MIIKASIKEELEGSFVYFVFSKDLLYIGETQKITFSRWIQHFYYKGTFYKKVNKLGYNVSDYLKELNLLSVELTEVREIYPENKWKSITQAIEHSLHELLEQNRANLIQYYYRKYYGDIDYYQIISDTSRTAPKYIPQSDWDFARNYAKNLMDKIYEYLN